MPHDIFISYSRKNLDAVKPIKEELEALGFPCWMDLEGIESGSRRFSRHIIDAIDGSKCMLFFLSSASQSSEWALKEIDYATSEKRNVVLVRFNDDPMTKEFRFDFGRADIIDWRVKEQKEKLLRDLAKWTLHKALACNAAHVHRPESVLPGTRKIVRVFGAEIALRWCPPGTFMMGSPKWENGRKEYETQHLVTLTNGFWMGETPITNEQWNAVMGKNPHDKRSCDDYERHPVDGVSWDQCQSFLKTLNARHQENGWRWALPTEAQWEYACRAGSSGAYSGSGELDDMGWHKGNIRPKTYLVGTNPVGRKRPNGWGLLDMHGNVWEWCADWLGNYPTVAVTNPTGASSGEYRIMRGGSFNSSPECCRSARRNCCWPNSAPGDVGFRVILAPFNF